MYTSIQVFIWTYSKIKYTENNTDYFDMTIPNYSIYVCVSVNVVAVSGDIYMGFTCRNTFMDGYTVYTQQYGCK